MSNFFPNRSAIDSRKLLVEERIPAREIYNDELSFIYVRARFFRFFAGSD